MPAFYAIALLIGFYALVVAEVLIPSGGLLGATALVTAVTSVIIGITYSFQFGMILLLVYLVTTPILFGIVIQLWPKTRIGRHMLNRETLESESVAPVPKTIDGTPLQDLVGKMGKSTTKLFPSGEIKVDGHKSAAVSTGLPIERDQWVHVIKLQAGKLLVREATDDQIAAMNPGAEASQESSPADSESPPSSSLEELNLDDLSFGDRP